MLYDIHSEGVKMQIIVHILAIPIHYFAFTQFVP